ncbi:MAG: hypothetical protein ACLR13_01975 [Acutalibacteraceae bacterium]
MLRKLCGSESQKVFIRSGIRYDYLMQDTDESFSKNWCSIMLADS